MQRILQTILENIHAFQKIVFSDCLPNASYKKIVLRLVQGKENVYIQAEQFTQKQVFHVNFDCNQAQEYVHKVLPFYKQVVLFLCGQTISFHILPNGKIKKHIQNNTCEHVVPSLHNRNKTYLLQEGENIPALRDLGVFTADNKIVKSMYDKYKQINKFVEMVDETLKKEDLTHITMLDFGCGKSYLTFILYYYFTVKRNINVHIIGYDIKRDVVEHCNKVAQTYGYKNLRFEVSDVSKDTLSEEHIDMVVSLHACNTATDYALHYAIMKKVPYIFSVPCCQHEINESIQKGGDFDIFLKHGLFKERFSALLTDAVRAEILKAIGYAVDVIEFVDLDHSPKNVMLRAKKVHAPNTTMLLPIKELLGKYGVQQTLLQLLEGKMV